MCTYKGTNYIEMQSKIIYAFIHLFKVSLVAGFKLRNLYRKTGITHYVSRWEIYVILLKR